MCSSASVGLMLVLQLCLCLHMVYMGRTMASFYEATGVGQLPSVTLMAMNEMIHLGVFIVIPAVIIPFIRNMVLVRQWLILTILDLIYYLASIHALLLPMGKITYSLGL